ncbi:secondary thiamine-phosphate synthase enzyme YjbQ [Wukongibacter sp. M2B1]|uniref:secondary thiamine-phosphate synthase enzyme YjbQ n=1 Tax=Wukongibacter sp. M2B1 TaxID=3088895 RepID=UPI003D795782
MIKHFNVQTNKQTEFIEITDQIKQVVSDTGITDGVCYIFIPHTTAAVTINENADPDVKSDMVMELNKIVPFDDNYKHFEGNSAAHIKSSLIGFSEIILIEGGKPVLGTWQGIYFCEFDGPRNRKVMVRIN